MNKKELTIIIYTIIMILSVMYATQPLQPLLAQEFSVSMVKASSFSAVIMLFLALSPIIYGYILESMNAKKMLIIASIILFFTNIFLGFSNSYGMFLFFRTCEAIVVPAILTACMNILANQKHKVKIQINMSIYVATTVFGGALGRILSGFIATQFGWRMVFFSLSFGLLLGLVFIFLLKGDKNTNMTKPKIKDISKILKDKRFFTIYSLMFVLVFVFVGLLNVLPFRIKEIYPQVSETQIGMLYIGYIVGVLVSLNIHRIINIFGKDFRAIMFGIIICLLCIFCFLSHNPIVIFLMVFALCLGQFIVHTIATRIANSLKKSKKALSSGMYLSFYYMGGTLGTILLPYIYLNYSWSITIYILAILLVFILIFTYFNKKNFKAHN